MECTVESHANLMFKLFAGLPEEDASTNGNTDEAQASAGPQTEATQASPRASPGKAQTMQRQLDSALQRATIAEKAAAAAKEAAATELALMRRQLTSAQAALAEAEQVRPLT